MAKNFELGLQLKLKGTKEDLNKQVSKLNEKVSKKINVGVKLNLTKKEIEEQITKFKKMSIKPIQIKVEIDVKDLNKQIQGLNSKINKKLEIDVGIKKGAVKEQANEVAKTTKKIEENVKASVGKIREVWGKGNFLKVDDESVAKSAFKLLEKAENQVTKLRTEMDKDLGFKKVVAEYKTGSGQIVTETMKWTDKVDKSGNVIKRVFETVGTATTEDLAKAAKATAKYELDIDKLNHKLSNFHSSMVKKKGLGLEIDEGYVKGYQSIKDVISKIDKDSITLTSDIGKANLALKNFNITAKELEEESTKKMFTRRFSKFGSAFGVEDKFKGEGRGRALEQQVEQELLKTYKKKQIAIGKVEDAQLKVNGKTLEYKRILATITKGNNIREIEYGLHDINGEIKKINENTRKMSLKDMGSMGKFKSAMSAFPIWMSAATIWMQAIRGLREGVRYIYEMDTAMTDLSKVVNYTSSEMNDMKDSAIQLGKEMGKSGVEIMKSYAEIGRVFKEAVDIEEFARVAAMASNVTTMTADAAAKAINTSMITFKLGIEDASKLLDQWNEIQNNYRKGMRY